MNQEISKVIRGFKLRPDELYIDSKEGFKIIKRRGITRIKNQLELDVRLTLSHASERQAVVMAETTTKSGLVIRTFGEASPLNNLFPYPVSVAQKRAISRLVIEVSGLMEDDWMGEDEIDFFIKDEQQRSKNEKKASKSIEDTKKALGL